MKEFQDNDNGGYGGEPKFPHFAFLEWAIEHMLEGMVPEEFGKHIIHSINGILQGGLYDHVRGGIHRYSVDQKWLVPHFEKMLYDQAGLLKLLSKASLIYPSPLVFDGLIQTIDYLKNEMLSEKGYFFAAQDADSEGVEGLYFTFSKDEFIDAIVDFDEELTDEMDTFLKWFKITEEGNFERQLNVISLDPKYKEEFYSPEGWNKVRQIRSALLEARKMRLPPATDNKGVASWNFQVVSALVDVVQYCKIESIALCASELLNSVILKIQETFIIPSTDGSKSRIITTTTRTEHVPLFEDYVYFCESQFRFYEISGNESFKETALQTLSYIFDEFYDQGQFLTRAKSFTDSQLYDNLHAPIFDQSYKAPLGTLFGLIRKWSTSADMSDYLEKVNPTIETITHLSLQNPLVFGETLRSLVYPDEAYRKIEVPLEWLKNNSFSKTKIKVNFPGVNGFNRRKMFIRSKNPILKKFSGSYASFKNYATTYEALSFFIEILFKCSRKVFVKSNFFDKKFILVSKYKEINEKSSIKLIIISGFIKKEVIYSKENTIEEEILSEIKKTLKIRIIKIPKNNGIKSLTY
jgi:uncharacterized protein YyaL (SSP411 family)